MTLRMKTIDRPHALAFAKFEYDNFNYLKSIPRSKVIVPALDLSQEYSKKARPSGLNDRLSSEVIEGIY
jgi:hypothetical protein